MPHAPMRQRAHAIATLLAAGVLAGCGGGDPEGPRPVTLALDFMPNAAHAGIYTAVAEGKDTKRGVDIAVRAPSGSVDSLKLLAGGRADLAVVDIHDLGLARERGDEVVGVGALVQRPLAAVIARRDIRRPRDLERRRVGVTGLPSDEAVLRAVVEHDGGDYSAVRRRTIGFSAVPSLVAGDVDAVVAFWNAEGVALRERGVRTREFRVDDYGAPGYPELVLAVRPESLEGERRKEIVRSLAAIAAGTREALRDRDRAAARIVAASDGDPPLVRRQLAAVAPALRPPIRLDRSALERWSRFDARFGILERRLEVRAVFSPLAAPDRPAGGGRRP